MVGEPGGQLRRLRGRPDAGERGLGPEGGREGGQGQEGFLGGGLSAGFIRLTDRQAGGDHSQRRTYTCKCQPSICIRHISGPAPLCSEGQVQVAGSGGLWHPFHEAANQGREESKASAPELPGFAHQPCASPASFWAAPFCPLSLSLPFCERRKVTRHLQICLRGLETLPAQAPAGAPETVAAVAAQVGSTRRRCSLGERLTVMCLLSFLFFQELTLKLGP